MKKKLLTLDDLYRFYSTKKKSMKFNADKEGYNLVVQVKGRFEVIDENEEGLMFCRVKAFHDLSNLNKSYIDTDVLKTKMYSINNRPILADIIEVEDENGNKIKDFNGHSMKLNEEEDKIEYIEIPVGHFVNPENIELSYDEENDRNFVYCDAIIYEEYTDTCDILRRKGETDVSVELAIRDLSYDCKNKVLKLNDFYVQGCTLLGEAISPGMKGAKLSLKDFSESNNSIFSEMTDEEHSKLIDTLERLNDTLTKFNINENNISTKDYGKEENENVEDNKLLNEEVEEVESTDETIENNNVTETETETESTEEIVETDAKKKKCEKETIEEDPEMVDVEEEVIETEAKKKKCEVENEEITNFSKTFELSHEDIRAGLYGLLAEYEELNNEWYWIISVYDDYFVYQGMMGNYWGQKYTVDNDNISFSGERYELFAEFVTQSEKAELEQMRSNYSSIQTELNNYKEAEEFADKMTVFKDESYSNYLETEEFKSLMDKENVKKFTKEELTEKADAALGKLVKKNKTFSFNTEKKEEKKATNFFAFARQEKDNSFLDKLLEK